MSSGIFFTEVIFLKYFQSGLTKKVVEKSVIQQQETIFSKLYMYVLVYILDEWILFNVQ